MRLSIAPICAALALLAACSDEGSPERQVRDVIEQMEIAAESRDVGALLEHVSENYRDAEGRGRAELSRYVRGYFIANQSVHLLTRIESIDFPTADEARLELQVGTAGRGAHAGALDVAVELYDFDVVLARKDGEWQVSHADWRAH